MFLLLLLFSFSTATFRQRLESTRQAWQIRSTLEKGLLIAVVALSILALGLTIGLAASGGKDNDNTPGLLKLIYINKFV